MSLPSASLGLVSELDIRQSFENYIKDTLENYVDAKSKSLLDFGYKVLLAPNSKNGYFESAPIGVIFVNYAGEVPVENTYTEMSFNISIFSRFLRDEGGATGIMTMLAKIKQAMAKAYHMTFRIMMQDESLQLDYYNFRLEYFTKIGE